MDEILLYLSLKHNGQWMAIYDSLQKREQFSVREVEKTIDEVDCSFVTLIDNKYVENLKSIYKPPFGLFCYGNYNLLNQNTVTVFADNTNEKYIHQLLDNNINVLWVDLSNKDMVDVINRYKKNNIFYMPEAKNVSNKTYQNILVNQDVIFDNAFVSEIWERKKDVDYSAQAPERLYLGLTKQVLVLTKLKSKQLYALANYAKNEDIRVVFMENVIDNKIAKLFANSKLEVIGQDTNVSDTFSKKK